MDMDMGDIPEHGDRVKDAITGYTGIVIGITDWLYGCQHVHIKREGLDKEGRPQDSNGFDIQRVEVLDKGAVPIKPAARPDNPVECGDEVKCLITGLRGIVTGVTHWDSEVAIVVQPRTVIADGEKAGLPTPGTGIVESQLTIIEKGVVKRPSLNGEDEEEAVASGRDRAKEDKAHPGGPADGLPKVSR